MTMSFYRKHLTSLNCKAVDFIAVNPTERILWLIEVKDYRVHARTKLVDICEEVQQKVIGTMAGILINKFSISPDETIVEAVRCQRIRVAFHLEQPRHHSKLFPKPFDLSDIALR